MRVVFVCMLMFIFLVVAAPSFFASFDAEPSSVSSGVFMSDLSVNDDSDREWEDLKQTPNSNSPEIETKVTVHINQPNNNRKKSFASLKSITSSKESYPTLPTLSEESESENEILMPNSSFQDRITFQPLPTKRYTPHVIQVEEPPKRTSELLGSELETDELEPLNRPVRDTQPSTTDTNGSGGGSMTPSTQNSLSVPSFLSNIFTKQGHSNGTTQDIKSELIELNNVNQDKAKTAETIIEITDLNDKTTFSVNYVNANKSEANGAALENTKDKITADQTESTSDCAVM